MIRLYHPQYGYTGTVPLAVVPTNPPASMVTSLSFSNGVSSVGSLTDQQTAQLRHDGFTIVDDALASPGDVPVFLADIQDSTSDAGAALRALVVVKPGGVSAAADTALIQAALDSNPGCRIFVSGTYTATVITSSTLTISHDRTILDGDVTLTPNFTGGPIVRVLNASYCRVTSGLFFDGNWQTNAVGLELMGALLGKFDLRGDRLPVGVNLDCANAAATQNSALNEIGLIVRNGVKGIAFKGKTGQYASNNTITRMEWWGAGTVISTGVEFNSYCDNNIFTGFTYLVMNFAGSVGVVYNSATPGSDMQVYENHFANLIVEADVVGATSIQGNRTQGSLGQWPSFVRLRTSGAQAITQSIGATSDVVLVDSNLNGAGTVGLRGEEMVQVPNAAIVNSSGATNSAFFGYNTWSMPDAATSAVNFQALVPSRWRAFDIVLLWAIAGTAAGNVQWQASKTEFAIGGQLGDVAAQTAVTAAAGGTQNGLTQTTVSSGLSNSGPLLWGRVSRLGTDVADTATDAARIVGIFLRRAS